jgi:asparagine N-glycosylation enzyme membrane subunit Stt3
MKENESEAPASHKPRVSFSLIGRIVSLLKRERRTVLWGAIAGILIGIIATFWLRDQILGLVTWIFVELAQFCRDAIAGSQHLH